MKLALLAIALITVLAGHSQAPPSSATKPGTAETSLRSAEEAAIKAFASRNIDQILSAYAADATLMLANSPILTGEDLRAALKALVADPNFTMQFRTDKMETAKSGEIGYTRGAYTLTMSDPKTRGVLREKGKYVTIYARQANGSWKIIEDIANADEPATSAATAKLALDSLTRQTP